MSIRVKDGILTADDFRGPGGQTVARWVPLEARTITSAVSSVDFDVRPYTAYRELIIEWSELTNTTDATNLVGFASATDSDSPTYATSYKNHIVRSNHISGTSSTMVENYSATRSNIEMHVSMGNDAFAHSWGWVRIMNWLDTARDHTYWSESVCWQGASTPGPAWSVSSNNPNAQMTWFRIKGASGNIDGGYFTLRGRNLGV